MLMTAIISLVILVWLMSMNRHGSANKVVYYVPSGHKVTTEQKDREVDKFLNDVQ